MKRGRSDLSKHPLKGEKVTVVRRAVFDPDVFYVDGVVSSGVKRRGAFTVKWMDSTGFSHHYTVRRRDEGKTWARGHGTPAANALKTVAALWGGRSAS